MIPNLACVKKDLNYDIIAQTLCVSVFDYIKFELGERTKEPIKCVVVDGLVLKYLKDIRHFYGCKGQQNRVGEWHVRKNVIPVHLPFTGFDWGKNVMQSSARQNYELNLRSNERLGWMAVTTDSGYTISGLLICEG